MADSAVENRMEFSEIKTLIQENRRDENNKIDEVYPGIYIGGLEAAMNLELLAQLGITHILNAAPARVKTDPEYYKSKTLTCEFMVIDALDERLFQLHPFFDASADFIDNALISNGKVLVHCYMGFSRSATLIIGYLMIKKKMPAIEAVKLILSKRGVHPNDGFIHQLCDLEDRLINQPMSISIN